MKKWVCALACAGMILTGGAAQADDLHLPSGETLPLGKEVTVWQGSDSYFAPKVAELLKNPKLTEGLAKDFIQLGVYKDSEKKEAEIFAKGMVDVLQASRVYQLRGVKGTTMYTACVLSLPMTLPLSAEDLDRWNTWWETYKTKWPENAKKLGDTTPGHGELAASVAEGLKWAKLVEKDKGVSKGGVSYDIQRGYVTPEYKGYVMPLFIYFIGTTKDSHMGMTFVFADQASGKYFEPFLAKGVEEAK